VKRYGQSLLAIALCGVVAATLGMGYVALSILALFAALLAGVHGARALAVAIVWPVLALAYAAYIVSSARRAEMLHGTTAPSPRERAIGAGIEDPKER